MWVAQYSGRERRMFHQKAPRNKYAMQHLVMDSTGSIPLSIWGEHIMSLKEGEFYTFTECRLRHYYGKCLTRAQSTTLSLAEKQDISKAVQQDVQTWICCPDILNIAVNPFLTCNNKDCKKKIVTTPGSQIAKCHHCNKSMLVQGHFYISKWRPSRTLYWSPWNQTSSTRRSWLSTFPQRATCCKSETAPIWKWRKCCWITFAYFFVKINADIISEHWHSLHLGNKNYCQQK